MGIFGFVSIKKKTKAKSKKGKQYKPPKEYRKKFPDWRKFA
jgi:hypothetical protein